MPLFRKKPKVFEANQFTHAATSPLGVMTEEDGRAYVITAHEQKVYLERGDWVVAEPPEFPNRFYPIKPAIMDKDFERLSG